MEDFILGLFEGAGAVNFNGVITIIIALFVIFWAIVLGWVWIDSGLRTTNIYLRGFSILLVLLLNVIGLIIYLIIRPSQTIQEIYWADLERRYLKYETAELGDCSKCAYQLQPGFTQCPNCSYDIKVKCEKCEVWIDKNWNSCAYCGEENTYKRKKKDREEISKEEMAEQVKASKEEAAEKVESKKTRYAVRSGIVESVLIGVRKVVSKSKEMVVKKRKVKVKSKPKSKVKPKRVKKKRSKKKKK